MNKELIRNMILGLIALIYVLHNQKKAQKAH